MLKMRKPIIESCFTNAFTSYANSNFEARLSSDSLTFVLSLVGWLEVLQHQDFQECFLAFLHILSVSLLTLGSKPKKVPFSWNIMGMFL